MSGRLTIICTITTALLSAGPAAALYTCIGADGKTSFVSDCQKHCDGKCIFRGAKKKKSATKYVAPIRTPKISPKAQIALDKKRAEILLYELHSEAKMTHTLDKAIAKTSPDNDSRLTVLQKKRAEHARNVIAIQQELSRLGWQGETQ